MLGNLSIRLALAATLAIVGLTPLLAPRPARAYCDSPIPVGHMLDGYFTGFPESTVSGRVWVFGDPSMSSGVSDVVCTERDDWATGATTCLGPIAGTGSDGIVLVATDWSWYEAEGCPTPLAVGDLPNVVVFEASVGEGTVHHAGVYLIVSVGLDGGGMWTVESAHPAVDDAGSVEPLAARPMPVPTVRSYDPSTGNVELEWPRAITDDDCAPDRLGAFTGTCTDFPGGTRPTLDAYRVYRARTSCDAPPTTSAASAWTLARSTTGTSFSDTVPTSGTTCTYYAIGLVSGGMPTLWVSASTGPIGERCGAGLPACDDGNPCSIDTCVAGRCAVATAPDTRSCDDGDMCNGRESCRSGVCTTTVAGPTCTASDTCHAATCDPTRGCVETAAPDGTYCIDTDPCNGLERCMGGACSAGTPPTCGTTSPCRVGTCDPSAGGCTEVAVADGTSCSDDNVCNGDETCSAGTCAAGTPLVCADPSPCIAGVCVPSTGCAEVPREEGAACFDPTPCAGAGSCIAGACDTGEPDACCLSGTCDGGPVSSTDGGAPVADGGPPLGDGGVRGGDASFGDASIPTGEVPPIATGGCCSVAGERSNDGAPAGLALVAIFAVLVGGRSRRLSAARRARADRRSGRALGG